MQLYVCYKYKNNNLYHISKEDVKWLSYLGVKYYLFHIWFHFWFHMFEKFAMKPCYLSLTPFFCVVYSQDILTVNIKKIVSIFFSVFDLMNCCKFQKPMMNQYLKRALLYKNYKLKCLNTK